MIAVTEATPSFLTTLPMIDRVGLGVVGLFLVLGLWRGLWWQVVRLLGVFLAVGLARSVSPRLTPIVQEALDLKLAMSHGLSWFVLFLAGLVVAALLGMLGKKALEALQLNLMDRVGGAVVGVGTGLSLHVALLVLLGGVGSANFKADHLRGSASWKLLEALAEHHVVAGEAGTASLLSVPYSQD
jgi:uncharacterized membrane protein required for colicin V production